MWTSRFVAAVILTLSFSPLAAAPSFADGTSITITKADIAAYKAALRLTAMQEVYWIPVAAALRALPTEGATFIVDEHTIGRLMPVLRPLFASLGEEQKRTALAFAQRMGLMQFASLM